MAKIAKGFNFLKPFTVAAPPTDHTSNELLEDLQRIYRLKGIINDYGNKAVRDIQNLQKKGLKKEQGKKR